MKTTRQRRYREISSGEGAEINLSPLIDMVFLLLIFFIVTSVFAERESLALDPPSARSGTPVQRDAVVIQVNASGEIFHRGESVPPESLPLLFRRLLAADAVPVLVESDTSTPAGDLVRILDAANLAGAPAVSLATRPSRNE